MASADWDEIKLIDAVEVTDPLTGSLKKADTQESCILAERMSVNRNEYYQAQLNGINVAAVYRVWDFEYNHENYIEVNGVRMLIERTYPVPGTEKIELICKSEAGDY
ncbi:MAG: phage head closure protein [Lachnospiraceae bacterium]|jgi:SPP1 family predicted phage head-tail adaptor|nr:phage head closure protein [Lachnospiraceae bacterium]